MMRGLRALGLPHATGTRSELEFRGFTRYPGRELASAVPGCSEIQGRDAHAFTSGTDLRSPQPVE